MIAVDVGGCVVASAGEDRHRAVETYAVRVLEGPHAILERRVRVVSVGVNERELETESKC